MARVLILGAGISGHTAALAAKRKLGKNHEVVVVSPNTNYQWVPSNIWVGVGRMTTKQVIFPLAPVYKKQGIIFKQAKAVSIHPDGDTTNPKQYVHIQYVVGEQKDQLEKVEYDYLINATGPKLNFAATEGLGPEFNSNSVCTYDHAEKTWADLQKCFAKMEKGEKQRFVVGTGNGMATCQGAAFEYTLNIAFELKRRNLLHLAELVWISNEFELGDFGMGGAYVKSGGYVTPTKIFAESIFKEYGVKWIVGSAVQKVEQGLLHYENLEGEKHTLEFDFAMLIPGFAGVGLKAFDTNGEDMTAALFAPNGFMKVDADYTPKPFEQWTANDWPTTYQNPTYDNIFACGIAFAPPHTISKPMTSKNGTPITATAPRTGMPSGVMGKVVAQNVADIILTGDKTLKHQASMAGMGAACVISAGYGFTRGKAATMTVFPIVQDWEKYPKWGRNLSYTVGEMGRAGHWFKWAMHYMFLYKAKARPLWWMIPE
ncbi:MAG: NAD(P)/FAD-dependent oxidoreductase [Paludibacteraceae bacterium]